MSPVAMLHGEQTHAVGRPRPAVAHAASLPEPGSVSHAWHWLDGRTSASTSPTPRWSRRSGGRCSGWRRDPRTRAGRHPAGRRAGGAHHLAEPGARAQDGQEPRASRPGAGLGAAAARGRGHRAARAGARLGLARARSTRRATSSVSSRRRRATGRAAWTSTRLTPADSPRGGPRSWTRSSRPARTGYAGGCGTCRGCHSTCGSSYPAGTRRPSRTAGTGTWCATTSTRSSPGERPCSRGPDEDIDWHVLADPEGNEFCAFRSH